MSRRAAAGASDRVAGLVLSSPFVPLVRDGHSTAATVADDARHRALPRRARAQPPPTSGGHPAWIAAALLGAGQFLHRDAPAAWLAAVDPRLERLDM